jgi:hypothetical protein
MRRPLLAAAVAVIGVTALIASSLLANAQSNSQKDAQESAPDVPDAIAVPEGQQVAFFVHAKGSQIYTCQPGADGEFAWTLKGPDAELTDRKDKVIGHHSADPTSKLPEWKMKDGSEVTGKAVAHIDSLDSDSIPWLLVNIESHGGKSGMLTNITTIQRVHTHGGKPSADDTCDESHKDTETKSEYRADYYFFAPPK